MKLRWIPTTLITIGYLLSYQISGITQQSETSFSDLNDMPITNPVAQLNLDRSRYQPKLQILLPLYIYPNWYDKDKYLWKQVITVAKKVPITAIVNPNNGPNNAPPNSDYQQGLQDLRQAGVKIIGYVSTNYAKRDIKLVKTDIDLYTKHFKIDGIFIDEAATTPDKLNYYQQLYQYIKDRSISAQVIINPGTDINEKYISQPVADTIVIFENYQKTWTNYRPQTYTKKYSPQNFAALVHTTSNRKLMKSTLDRAVKSRFGYIYVTNDSTDANNRNPWDTLPEYWQAEVNYIHQINIGK
jgi:Spherulation-specific family 4